MPLPSSLHGLLRQRASPEDCPGARRRASREIQPLLLPLPFNGPVAVLESGFRLERGMREFEADDYAGVEAFGPCVVVAPLHAAVCLADRQLRGLIALSTLEFALVVLTRVDDERLGDHHRDLLWSAFGVPAFEQLRDAEGCVIARECEVHDGLHLVNRHPGSGLSVEIETSQCECGADTPRLVKLAPLRPKAAAAAA